MSKKKVIVISDHALSTSGVGVQTRHLLNGLVKKGVWTFRQLGAAIKHDSYEPIAVNEDFIIKPIDGFGNKEMIRSLLVTEKPDALLIFTDPRFFTWLFDMEDEVHQICPILWWHVWDNRPTPRFNDFYYEATDAINCHSYLTYMMCRENFPDKTGFIPHAIPEEIFYPLSQQQIDNFKQNILGEKKDHFICFWVNRNARRKRPGDLLQSWRIFLDELQAKHGHQKASLIMHTDPLDKEGPNLIEVSKMLGISDNVIFSSQKVGFQEINVLHNIADCTINISNAEGFGLSTLEAMQTGTPIIAVKTGGQTRQVVNHKDFSQNGIALDVEFKTLVGSQTVPYIYEDYVSSSTIGRAILKMYEWGPEKRKEIGLRAREYALSEFAYQKTVDQWHDSLTDTIENWKERRQTLRMETF